MGLPLSRSYSSSGCHGGCMLSPEATLLLSNVPKPQSLWDTGGDEQGPLSCCGAPQRFVRVKAGSSGCMVDFSCDAQRKG